MKNRVIGFVLSALLLGSAQAAENDPIFFTQAGDVTFTLLDDVGGFDHLLDLASVGGTVSAPIVAASSGNGSNAGSGLVLYNDGATSFAVAPIGTTVSLGSFAANQELVFRLTNIFTDRFGDTVGDSGGQLFTGSSSGLNPATVLPDAFSFVTYVDSTHIQVGLEDLFPDRHEYANMKFELTLTPVPEPETYALALAGLLAIGFLRRRRG